MSYFVLAINLCYVLTIGVVISVITLILFRLLSFEFYTRKISMYVSTIFDPQLVLSNGMKYLKQQVSFSSNDVILIVDFVNEYNGSYQ